MKPEKENTTNSDLFDAELTNENPRFPRADENLADLCELSLEDLAAIQGGYKYDFSLTAESRDDVGFSSAFNITDDLHIQNTGNTLNVKLPDIKFG